MARNKKQLSNAFVGFSKNDGKHIPKNEQGYNGDIPKDVTVISNNECVTNDITQDRSILSVEQVKNDLLNMYQEKSKKETMEDTHTRATFLFRKDLAKRLDKLAKNKRGFKTMFMNKAIEALLDEMEK